MSLSLLPSILRETISSEPKRTRTHSGASYPESSTSRLREADPAVIRHHPVIWRCNQAIVGNDRLNTPAHCSRMANPILAVPYLVIRGDALDFHLTLVGENERAASKAVVLAFRRTQTAPDDLAPVCYCATSAAPHTACTPTARGYAHTR